MSDNEQAAMEAAAHAVDLKTGLTWDDCSDIAEAAVSAYLAALRDPSEEERRVTTPHDDPIVAACVRNGGHFWPEDAPENEPATCTRCWYNPGWKAGKPRNEHELRRVVDRPEA